MTARSENWPESVTPITRLVVRLFRVSGLIVANAAALVAAYGLTFSEFEALAALRGSPPPHDLSPTDLYGAVLMSSGGMTKVLHKLEERGLVSRPAVGGDRRTKPVRLTAAGRALAEKAMADILAAEGKLIVGGLAADEIEGLTQLLSKLLAAVEPAGGET